MHVSRRATNCTCWFSNVLSVFFTPVGMSTCCVMQRMKNRSLQSLLNASPNGRIDLYRTTFLILLRRIVLKCIVFGFKLTSRRFAYASWHRWTWFIRAVWTIHRLLGSSSSLQLARVRRSTQHNTEKLPRGG